MLKWKWILMGAGASLLMYGCSAKEAAAPSAPPQETWAPEAAKAAEASGMQDLYKLRNPLIGDVSADGRLVDAAKHQFGVTNSSTIELVTQKEPYELILHFKKEPDYEAMKRSAVVLLSLIDNCGIVSWDYPLKQSGTASAISVDSQAASKLAGVVDIKSYSQTSEHVEELLSLLHNMPDTSDDGIHPVTEASKPEPVTGCG